MRGVSSLPKSVADATAGDREGAALRHLWVSVLAEQLRVASGCLREVKPYERDAARRWFGSRDFYMVCALAGLDGDYMLRLCRPRLEADISVSAQRRVFGRVAAA